MKKITGLIVFITIVMSGVAFADDTYRFELSAGHSFVEARFDLIRDIDYGRLITGIGGIYNNNDDDFKIGDVKVALENEILTSGLRCALGFKGLLGEVELDNDDGDLAAIGFLLSIGYDIPETFSPIPLEVFAEMTVAPESMCFSDSEKYMEIITGLGLHILENASIVAAYKYIDVHFDKGLADQTMTDHAFSIGYQLNF